MIDEIISEIEADVTAIIEEIDVDDLKAFNTVKKERLAKYNTSPEKREKNRKIIETLCNMDEVDRLEYLDLCKNYKDILGLSITDLKKALYTFDVNQRKKEKEYKEQQKLQQVSIEKENNRIKAEILSKQDSQIDPNTGLSIVLVHEFSEQDTIQPKTEKQLADEISDLYINRTKEDISVGIYRKNNILIRLTQNDQENIIFESLTDPIARAELSNYMCFYEITGNIDKGYREKKLLGCSKGVIEHFNNSREIKEKFPLIKYCVNFPILVKENNQYKIVNKPGYNEKHKVFLNPKFIEPIEYTKDINEIEETLRDVFNDFPYTEEADYYSSIAQLLTPIIRFALPEIERPVPIFFTTSPQRGAGKSLESEVISLIITGVQKASESEAENQELRKRFLSSLIEGKDVILLDNINDEVDSSILALYGTQPVISDRILGINKTVEMENTLIFFVNGLRTALTDELIDRAVIKEFRTSKRAKEREFRHKELKTYVRKNRAKILNSVYSLIQLWIDNGCQESKLAKHRMNLWASLVGGIIEQLPDGHLFLTTQDKNRQDTNPDYMAWCAFCKRIVDEIAEPGELWTSQDAYEVGVSKFESINEGDPEIEILGALRPQVEQLCSGTKSSARTYANALGRLLSRHKNHTFGKYKLLQVDQNGPGYSYRYTLQNIEHSPLDGLSEEEINKRVDNVIDELKNIPDGIAF